MYSVFSQFIVDTWKRENHVSKDVPTEITLSDMINNIYSKYKLTKDNKVPYCIQALPGVLWCNVITTLDDIVKEASEKLWINTELLKVLRWIELNIIAEMPKMRNRTTLNVKIRIAVNMLNKLKQEGIITKDLNLFYFHNVVTNSLDLWFDIAFDGNINELPF